MFDDVRMKKKNIFDRVEKVITIVTGFASTKKMEVNHFLEKICFWLHTD